LAGYSVTPLVQKLGLKENYRLAFVSAPPEFSMLLGELPQGATILRTAKKPLDLVVLFTTKLTDLTRRFERLAPLLAPAGMLWVAWPKKSSGVSTDLSENIIRQVGLDRGLVDIKVCAIDEVWSGLKFVMRVKDRAKP